MTPTYTAGFIGCGNMGSALACAVLRAVDAHTVAVFDPQQDKISPLVQAGAVPLSAEQIAAQCKLIFLGVKPQILPGVLAQLAGSLAGNPDATLVSMAAAVPIESIRRQLAPYGAERPVIRILPNTPAAVGCGMTVYAPSEDTQEGAITLFEQLMRPSGELLRIEEGKIDAAGTLSGCGPAFAYMFAEALADAGVACGLPRELSSSLTAQMLLGAAQMLKTHGHPAALKDAVCSPGGTTIEGVRALEAGGFRGTAMQAVVAAYEKTLRLKK